MKVYGHSFAETASIYLVKSKHVEVFSIYLAAVLFLYFVIIYVVTCWGQRCLIPYFCFLFRFVFYATLNISH